MDTTCNLWFNTEHVFKDAFSQLANGYCCCFRSDYEGQRCCIQRSVKLLFKGINNCTSYMSMNTLLNALPEDENILKR